MFLFEAQSQDCLTFRHSGSYSYFDNMIKHEEKNLVTEKKRNTWKEVKLY